MNAQTNRHRVFFAVALLGMLSLGLFAERSAQAQATPTFSNGTFTSNAVLGLPGTPDHVVYGVTFGDSTSRTTANGYAFGSSYYNNNTNASYAGSPVVGYLSGGGTSGDTAFDSVLTAGACGGGATGALTLNNLNATTTYNVLFLLADTRSGVGARTFSITSGATTSGVQQFAYVAGTPALGAYVMATFTATGPTQTFQINSGPYGYQLNAVVVAVAQAPVSFTTGTITGTNTLSLAGTTGQEIFGVSFGDATSRTTAAGYTFASCTTNTNPNASCGGIPVSGYLPGGTSGDTAFDAVLNCGMYGGSTPGVVILKNLTVHATYNALFLVADTRSGVGTRTVTITSGSASSIAQSYAYAGGTTALGGYVMATFTATGSTQQFQITSPGSDQVNGLLVCQQPDTTLLPVVVDNIPTLTPIFAAGVIEGTGTNEAGTPHTEFPLYYPYDMNNPAGDAFWDEAIDEQLQARFPSVMLTDTGTLDPNPADFANCPGAAYGGNPYDYPRYIRALNRASGGNVIKFTLFARSDTALRQIYDDYYNLPANTPTDLNTGTGSATPDSYYQIWWLRFIKPWLDSVPQNQWFLVNGRLPIEFWGIGPNGDLYQNAQGNVSKLFEYIATQMETNYHVQPMFETGTPLFVDSTLGTPSPDYIVTENDWYGGASGSYTMKTLNGITIGCMVPGALQVEAYWTPGTPYYMDPSLVLPRNGQNGTGNNGDTFLLGLNAMVSSNALLTTIEGYTDYLESCGIYRSDDPSWDYPNQYLNLVRQYSDLRTVTERLQVEGCDEYSDPGGTGGVFRRSGNLDIQALTGAPSIIYSSQASVGPAANAFDGKFGTKWTTASTGPGFLEYDYGSGNTNTMTGYAITSAADTQNWDPATWLFQGSNDGSTWTTLDSETAQVFAARGQTNTYNVASPGAYRYYKLNVSASYGGSSNGVQLAELSLYGTVSTGGGWVVGPTVASEWVQFDEVNFTTGNYKFAVRYSSTAAHTLQLSLDGVALPAVTLPSTGSMSTYQTAYVGIQGTAHGQHTVRLTSIDGGVDLDWIFIKKYDPMLTFKSALNGNYVYSTKGGNSTISCDSMGTTNWEQFSVDDAVGAGAVVSGDSANIQTWDGLYVTATSGGGGALTAATRIPLATENWTITNVSGSGPLAAGNTVAIKSSNGNYLTVESDGSVDATGTTIGTAQKFVLGLNSQ